MAGTITLPIWQQLVYRLSTDEAWEGNVEAPGGAFCALTLTKTESALVEIARGVSESNMEHHYLISEDEQGFLTFIEYGSKSDLKIAYQEASARYDAWDDEDGSEVG